MRNNDKLYEMISFVTIGSGLTGILFLGHNELAFDIFGLFFSIIVLTEINNIRKQSRGFLKFFELSMALSENGLNITSSELKMLP